MSSFEVFDKRPEVVSMPFGVRNPDKRFDTLPARRRPARVNKIIRGKSPFGRVNINVIKIEHNESRMLEERIISSRRKLPAETYNGDLLLFGFITFSDLRY